MLNIFVDAKQKSLYDTTTHPIILLKWERLTRPSVGKYLEHVEHSYNSGGNSDGIVAM